MNEIALFDLDGSLADYDKGLLNKLKLMKSPQESLADSLWELERNSWMKERIETIKALPGFWENLEPIKMGFDVYHLTEKIGFKNEILTKGPKKHSIAWAEKLRWCQNHFGDEIDVHVTCNKGRVFGKVLYDDFPEYMLKWLEFRPRGLGIMPVNQYNKNFSHPQVIMYDGKNLDEVEIALKKAFNRSPREKE